MKKLHLLKSIFLLCALIVGSTSLWAADTWVKTAPADLQTGDIVVIVDQTSGRAMSNNNGTSAPSAVAVTLNGDKSEITSAVATTIQWELTTSGSGNSKTFKFANESDFLYVTATNNGVKVGEGERNTFTITTGGDNSGYYLYNGESSDNRYVGCYNSSDWRCYGSINNNIKGNNNAFYKKTASSGPVDPAVTMDVTTIGVGQSSSISYPVALTTISFESDNSSVASVSDEGVVTGVAEGNATITATWTAVTGVYNAGSQVFNVTIIPVTTYVKVTSANQLVAGNEFILVATGNNKAMGAADGSIRTPIDVTISDDKISISDEEVVVLTLGGSSTGWTFLASDNSKYLALTSSSNAIHASTDATIDESKWTISNDFQLTNVKYGDRVLKYNSASPRFACYTSGQQAAVLFVKSDAKYAVKVADASGLATFAADSKLDFSGVTNLEAYIAKEEGSEINLYKVDIVDAGTGVLLRAKNSATDFEVPMTDAAADDDTDNIFVRGNDAAVATSGGGYYNYILSKKSGVVGFYNANGNTVAKNRAYIHTTLAEARIAMDFSDATGIDSISNKERNAVNSQYYNLAGQRVVNPTKGLYIVNGKKIIK